MAVDDLVVAEKNSVAKAFVRALLKREVKPMMHKNVPYYQFSLNGRSWAVLGLRGHLMDLDFEPHLNAWKKVDPIELFYAKPLQVVERRSRTHLELLKELGRYAEVVYLALDGDSEGESIAHEVMSVVESVNPYAEFKRLWFSDTLPSTLLNSLESPRAPNKLLADKCFARMEIDLTIGAAFTRLLTLSVESSSMGRVFPKGHFLSYGPCQTPVLYLVVQRAREREQFKPEGFYRIIAKVKVGDVVYEAEHERGRLRGRDEAEAIASRARPSTSARVEELEEKRFAKAPPLPLNTVELESRASRYLNLRPKVALDLAENLYRLGLISYPRTETQVYPQALNLKSVLEKLRKISTLSNYISRLLSSGFKPTRGSKDDKAHPPIHPVEGASEKFVRDRAGYNAWRLYDLIARHFLATLSEPALFLRQRAVLNVGGELFYVTGLKPIEVGFLEVYKYEAPSGRELRFNEGELGEVLEVSVVEGQTEPPPYMSEAELLKLMEKLGIGTDATASQHIQTNIKRGYFYVENRRCIPTPLGRALIKALEEAKEELVKPEVRALIERQIAQVLEGKKSKGEVVKEAKEIFLSYFNDVKQSVNRISSSLLPTLAESYRIRDARSGRRRKGIYF